MAPSLLPSLLGSLTRQLSRAVQYASVTCLPAAGACRCISTITTYVVQTRGSFQAQHNLFRAPLLGQNQHFGALQPSMGMKTKTALKKRCKDCFFVRRHGRLYVFCKSHPRHKQRQGWICPEAFPIADFPVKIKCHLNDKPVDHFSSLAAFGFSRISVH